MKYKNRKMTKDEEGKCAWMSAKVFQALKEGDPDAYKEEIKLFCEEKPPGKAFENKMHEMFPRWTTYGEFDE